MTRFFLTLVALLQVAESGFAAEPQEWITFEEPSERFSIRLPSTPVPKEICGGGDKKNIYYQCKSEELDCHFDVCVMERPTLQKGETIEKHYEEIAGYLRDDPLVKSLSTKQSRWKGKYPVFEMSILSSTAPDNVVEQTYFIATPKDVIVIEFKGPKASIESKQVAECLDSLTIKE